ncbi:MAG: hypothetical protein U1F49_07835 [Rubrivivax sp.]
MRSIQGRTGARRAVPAARFYRLARHAARPLQRQGTAAPGSAAGSAGIGRSGRFLRLAISSLTARRAWHRQPLVHQQDGVRLHYLGNGSKSAASEGSRTTLALVPGWTMPA